ncbi:squalene/phytoene synthase family protein [Candidatus Pelagibacter sp.]|nr:squalene/phytoene synthase family protein [Candidatus Pelagibacter sp.]
MSAKNYLATYAKSFNWAGFFLPKNTYKKCSDLYDFCRVVDNIADDENTIESKIEEFKKFKNNFENKNFNDPVIKNIWSIISEHNISVKIIHDLFDGINSDIKEQVKLNTKKELILYSYRVAGTVGLMMAKILKVNKKNSLKSAIDLGIAMQLTNISRDVIEDFNNNRIYIDQNFENIKSTIKLSEKFYENSFYSIKEIPLSFRFSILVARRVYRKIGYKILSKKNFENYKKSGKIYVNNVEKIVETLLSIVDLLKLVLTNHNDDNIEHDHYLINQEIKLDERI